MANCSDEMYLITLDTKLTPLIQNTTEYLIKVSDDTIFRPECGSRFLDANIISAVENEDENKITFTIVVRMPSVRFSLIDIESNPPQNSDLYTSTVILINGYKTTLNNLGSPNISTGLVAPLNIYDPSFNFAIQVPIILSTLNILKEQVNANNYDSGDINIYNNAKTAILVEINKLINIFSSPNTINTPENSVFAPQEFTIYTQPPEDSPINILTFLVSPLRPEPYVNNGTLVATGTINPCYRYEISRIGALQIADDDICICDGVYMVPPNGYCLRSNILQISFPLTECLYCFMNNSCLDTSMTLPSVIVKIVGTSGDQDFIIPAKMSFDIKNCMAIVEISNNVLISYGFVNNENNYLNQPLYPEVFGNLAFSVASSSLDNNGILDPAFNIVYLISRADEIKIMGVTSCTEKVFFTFNINTLSYPGIDNTTFGNNIINYPGIDNTTYINFNNTTTYNVSSTGSYSYAFFSSLPGVTYNNIA